MFRPHISSALACSLLVAAGCDHAPTASYDAQPSFAMQHAASRSSSDILTFYDLSPVGTSHIVRNHRGVTTTLHTSGLTPGNAYTVWAVVFNDPSGCSDECGEDDLSNPAAVADVLYVAGNIAGGKGSATFSGRRKVGDSGQSLFAMLGAPSPGLMDGFAAEIHVVVRDHGPATPGQIPGQIHSFEGSCTPESSLDLGSGPYECADVQFAVHLP